VVKERCVRNGKNEMKRIENRSDNADDADDGDDDVIGGSRLCQYLATGRLS